MSFRKTPATFPMGFRGQVTPEVLIIDFLDQAGEEESARVFYSIALTRDIALKLSEALADFAANENLVEDDDENES